MFFVQIDTSGKRRIQEVVELILAAPLELPNIVMTFSPVITVFLRTVDPKYVLALLPVCHPSPAKL